MSATPAPLGQLQGEANAVSRLGAKGAWLHWLVEAGAAVPAGFVIDVGVLSRAQAGADQLHGMRLDAPVEEALAGLLQAGAVAVRASPVESRPGLLPTRLGCVSRDDVCAALDAIACAAEGAQLSTAAVVQRQVEVPGDGFAAALFTRDPSRGHRGIRGAFSPGTPGAAVVDGRSSPPPLEGAAESLRERWPERFTALQGLADVLEARAGQILELEVVHDGETLWVVQARPAPREPAAALRLASERAKLRPAVWLDLAPSDLDGQVVERVAAGATPLAEGLAASPGVAEGRPVHEPDRALALAQAGESVIFVRPHALPEDVPVVEVAAGVLTTTGGLTCHAAVVARGLRKPAVVSCRGLVIDAAGVTLAGERLSETTRLTLDGHTGKVYAGSVPRTRLPSGVPLRKLLGLLRERREVPLWVHGASPAIASELAQLGVDALVVPPGTLWEGDAGGLAVWEIGDPSHQLRPLAKEHSAAPCVDKRAWDDMAASNSDGVRWADGPPPAGCALSGTAPLVVPMAHLWDWALCLEPVAFSHYNGPSFWRAG